MKFCTLYEVDFRYFIIDLFIALVGVQIGAPYRAIGLISESNRVSRALNDNFERIILRFNPKNALKALVLRADLAVLSSPEF